MISRRCWSGRSAANLASSALASRIGVMDVVDDHDHRFLLGRQPVGERLERRVRRPELLGHRRERVRAAGPAQAAAKARGEAIRTVRRPGRGALRSRRSRARSRSSVASADLPQPPPAQTRPIAASARRDVNRGRATWWSASLVTGTSVQSGSVGHFPDRPRGQHRLGARAGTELLVDVLEVLLDGSGAHGQLVGDSRRSVVRARPAAAPQPRVR